MLQYNSINLKKRGKRYRIRHDIVEGRGLRELGMSHISCVNALYDEGNLRSASKVRIYSSKNTQSSPAIANKEGKICLSSEDVVATASYISNPSKRMMILDFGSSAGILSDIDKGRYTQEVALCCESNLYSILNNCNSKCKEFHRLDSKNKALYIPDVGFMGNIKTEEYRDGWLYEPFFMADVLSCPITDRISDAGILNRLEFIVDIGIKNGIDILVLGAWGCGLGKIDASRMSRVMRECLVGNKLAKHFDSVVFAIPHYIDKMNYTEFSDTFQDMAAYF